MSKTHNADLNRVCGHLSILGLGKETPVFINKIQAWSRNNGPEWTIDRLKDLKQALIALMAGNSPKYETWIAHRKDGLPKGIWKPLFRRALISPKRARNVLSALMVYTGYVSPKLTEKQLRKAREAIFQSEVPVFDRSRIRDDAVRAIELLAKSRTVFDRSYTEKFSFAGLSTSKPILRQTSQRSKVRWVDSFSEWVHINAPWNPILARMGVPLRPGSLSYRDIPMGRISVIQERGYKARVVAVPNAAVQVAFRPLHQALNEVLRNIQQDCTFNQEEGAEFARSKLAEGITCHAVDLSSATDNFPIEYQMVCLKLITGERDISDIFERTVRYGTWMSPDGDTWKYTKGQPMGLYGSFALFAFSHHVLVQSLWNGIGKDGPAPYRILGDDIVIADDELHRSYREALVQLAVPVSEHKCVSSDRLSEFAGYVITPQSYWKPAKVPSPKSFLDNSFVDYLRIVGPVGLRNLPSRVRRVAKKIRDVPDFLGGLGWNPNGVPLEVRIEKYLALLAQSRDIVPPLGDLIALLRRRFYEAPVKDREVLIWLIDQINAAVARMEGVLATQFPQLANLPAPSRQVFYQLLSLKGDVPGEVFVGVVDTAPDHQFTSQLSSWEKKLKLAEVSRNRETKDISDLNLDREL